MTLYQPEPVEISTRIRQGEWTEESLQLVTEGYVAKMVEMGALREAVLTLIERHDDGSVSINVSWDEGGPDKGLEPAT